MLQARIVARGVAAAAVAGLCGVAVAGPDWVEIGDAGSELSTAQVTNAASPNLSSISGALGGGFLSDYEDCYLIQIVNPSSFSMQVSGATFDPQLFLFNISVTNGAFGLLANDDQSPESNLPRMFNTSNDGTNVVVSLPGLYMLAITGFNRDPVSETGPMFTQETRTEVSGPDGPGGFNPLTGWTGTGQFGSYTIVFAGAGPATPAPGAAVVLGLGALVGMRRRR